ncbi:SDR family oxidoreductase [Paenibacillus sp. LS1]|uniref:SDR family NAD(P)-dependent oxidoreductase n=1 Tax=Paenibacillus sp. LS1 TaxID=2992120 RepID=UPI002231E860|nr:SDR family NAD(P)-dependent oxidoreductase [Paenibacillus sp. LS1]MCW3790247.1 SDR family oxidoreductase [Paenibacillus sp. LS1]
MCFEDKVIVVVGGTSGIGRETAFQLAAAGASIVITGRDQNKAEDTLKELKSKAVHPDHMVAIAGDATKTEDVKAVFHETMHRFGKLDILVHVAGISGRKFGDGPLDECTEQGWDVVMESNLKSVYLTNHEALNLMKAQHHGNIINVSSVLGLVGAREHFVTHAYAASRAAVIQLSRSAAVYYSKHNIRINVVCPGLLDTPMSQRAINDNEIRDALTLLQPLTPHIGYPDDVAQAILFLASEESKFITGIALPIDGGWTAQ